MPYTALEPVVSQLIQLLISNNNKTAECCYRISEYSDATISISYVLQ